MLGHWATSTVLQRPWNAGSQIPDPMVHHGCTAAGLADGTAVCANDADTEPATTSATAAATEGTTLTPRAKTLCTARTLFSQGQRVRSVEPSERRALCGHSM